MASLALLVVVLAAKAGEQIACGGPAPSRDGDAWERARGPVVAAFCDSVAQGSARLGRDPTAAIAAADEADALLPDQAVVCVLRGRALVELGRLREAQAVLERGAALDPQTLSASPALLALARAQRGTKSAAAVTSYRALVPQTEGLATEELRSRALLEAGEALLDEGPSGAPEAIAVFGRLVASGDLSTRTRAKAWLALALDRSGLTAEASFLAAAAAREGAVVLVREKDAASASFGPLLATLLAERDPVEAARVLRTFVDKLPPKSPWEKHARARIDALSKQRPVAGMSGAPSPAKKPAAISHKRRP